MSSAPRSPTPRAPRMKKDESFLGKLGGTLAKKKKAREGECARPAAARVPTPPPRPGPPGRPPPSAPRVAPHASGSAARRPATLGTGLSSSPGPVSLAGSPGRAGAGQPGGRGACVPREASPAQGSTERMSASAPTLRGRPLAVSCDRSGEGHFLCSTTGRLVTSLARFSASPVAPVLELGERKGVQSTQAQPVRPGARAPEAPQVYTPGPTKSI
jgi:hypothetical protein